MAAILPLLAMGIPALISAISGGVSIAGAVKQLKGSGLRHRRARRGHGFAPMYYKRPYTAAGYGLRKKKVVRKKKGRGMLYPAGGHGFAPMYYKRPYTAAGYGLKKRKAAKRGRGLLFPAGHRVHPIHHQAMLANVLKAATGGALVHRRGYYKHVGGKRVHVRPALVHKGGALHHRRGHYKHMPGRRVHVRGGLIRRRGGGPVADALSNIPLLGMIAGPIARAFGGRVMKRRYGGGRHGNPHRMATTLRAILAGGNGIKAHHRRGHYKHVAGKRVHVKAATVHRGGYVPYASRYYVR